MDYRVNEDIPESLQVPASSGSIMIPKEMQERRGVALDAATLARLSGSTQNVESAESEEPSVEVLAGWFITQALVLDNMGLTSHAVTVAASGVEHCRSRITSSAYQKESETPNIFALKELSTQLHHFSQALYAGLLNENSSFVGDWLSNPISRNILTVLQSWVALSTSFDGNNDDDVSSSPNAVSVVDVLVKHIRPMSDGKLRLFKYCSPQELIDRLVACLHEGSDIGEVSSCNGRTISEALEKALQKSKETGIDNVLQSLLSRCRSDNLKADDPARVQADLVVEDAFERAVVAALGRIVTDGNRGLKGLHTALKVASASLPTLPRRDRCLRSPLRLASMVVNVCGSFDNTYVPSSTSTTSSSSLPLMWSLIETTPASLSEFDVDGVDRESERLSAQLDSIQAALDICEVVQCYMTPPPLFLLLGDQSERQGRASIVRCGSVSIRQARRAYIRDLLTGCGFLVAGLTENILDSQEERDVLNANEKGTASGSTSVEVLSNMVSLGQALVLRICFEYGKKQEHSGSYDSDGTRNDGNDWTTVAKDVIHLCSFMSTSVPSAWAGHAFMQCMMHYEGVNSDFKRALEGVLDAEEEKLTGKYNARGLEGNNESLGNFLSFLGVESAHMERLVLKRALEIFNSVPSCDSKELQEVDQLLALLPQQSPDAAVATAVRTERALMELVGLLSTLQVDLLPLQLRLLSPGSIAAKLLEQRPQVYYQMNGNGDFEELYCNQLRENGGNGGEDRVNLLLRRTMLRERAPPGARLVRVLLALIPDAVSAPHSESISASVPAGFSLNIAKAEVRLELLFAAISLGELEGAYCLCRALLKSTAVTTLDAEDVLPHAILQRISEATLLVIGMLECPDPDSGGLHQALRYDLLSLVLSTTPISQLERCSSLWRQMPPLLLVSSSISSFSQDVADTIASRDAAHIAAARDALLDMTARMLRRSELNGSFSSMFLQSPSESVVSAGVDSSRLSDAIGHLLLVSDNEMVHGLIEKLYADLDKKLSTTLMRERQTQTHSNIGRNKLDDALVDRVSSKGFSRNSAKRAVLATRGEGFKEALSWAVEHSLDEDFEYPIAESVKGALLSERQEDLSSLNPDSMRGALKVLADVSDMYQRHCASKAVLSPTIPTNKAATPPPKDGFTMDQIYPDVVIPEESFMTYEVSPMSISGNAKKTKTPAPPTAVVPVPVEPYLSPACTAVHDRTVTGSVKSATLDPFEAKAPPPMAPDVKVEVAEAAVVPSPELKPLGSLVAIPTPFLASAAAEVISLPAPPPAIKTAAVQLPLPINAALPIVAKTGEVGVCEALPTSPTLATQVTTTAASPPHMAIAAATLSQSSPQAPSPAAAAAAAVAAPATPGPEPASATTSVATPKAAALAAAIATAAAATPQRPRPPAVVRPPSPSRTFTSAVTILSPPKRRDSHTQNVVDKVAAPAEIARVVVREIEKSAYDSSLSCVSAVELEIPTPTAHVQPVVVAVETAAAPEAIVEFDPIIAVADPVFTPAVPVESSAPQCAVQSAFSLTSAENDQKPPVGTTVPPLTSINKEMDTATPPFRSANKEAWLRSDSKETAVETAAPFVRSANSIVTNAILQIETQSVSVPSLTSPRIRSPVIESLRFLDNDNISLVTVKSEVSPLPTDVDKPAVSPLEAYKAAVAARTAPQTSPRPVPQALQTSPRAVLPVPQNALQATQPAPAVPTILKPASQARVSTIPTSNNTVLKAHLVSRLRGALDIAEDFTGMGVHAADLARSIANKETIETGEDRVGGGADVGVDDSDGVYEQIYQVCRALATHRRLAAFEFIPQLLAVLPYHFLRDVAYRTEQLIFVGTLRSDPPNLPKGDRGSEQDRATWVMAALRLLAFHTSGDPLTYSVCTPVIFALPNTYRTVLLLAHLYRGLQGDNINALTGVLKIAADHLTTVMASLTADTDSSAVSIGEAALAIEISTTSPSSFSLLCPTSDGDEERTQTTLMASVASALKQLLEDVAVLRRVGRIPDITGVDAKRLLRLQSDDLFVFNLEADLGETDKRRQYKQRALIALGPHLFPQTIAHWVRVIGKQLGLSTADMSFQYACSALSTTMTKYSSTPKGGMRQGGQGEEAEPWPLLANELASCVRRMRPDHTYALCLIVGGMSLSTAAVSAGCQMLFPVTPVPDQVVDILISAICAAVQKLALPTALTSAAPPSASMTVLSSLTAQQAQTLLPSLTSVKQFLLAIHQHLPDSSSMFRTKLMRHDFDREIAIDGSNMIETFSSLLSSPLGANNAVMQIASFYFEIAESEASDHGGCSGPTPMNAVKTDKKNRKDISNLVEAITAAAVAFCLTIVTSSGGLSTQSSAVTKISECIVCNSYSNFGSPAVKRVITCLLSGILESSSSFTLSSDRNNGSHGSEGSGGVTIDDLKTSLSLARYFSSFLRENMKDAIDLKELWRDTVEPSVELLFTRHQFADVVRLLDEANQPNQPHSLRSTIRISLHKKDTAKNPYPLPPQYYLSTEADREALFLHLADTISKAPSSSSPLSSASCAAAVRAALALVALLRCWGLSRTEGNFQTALESSLPSLSSHTPHTQPLPCDVGDKQYPNWMSGRFHFAAWGKVLDLLKQFSMHLDMIEVTVVDIDIHCSALASDALHLPSSEDSRRDLVEKVSGFAISPSFPDDIKQAFGLLVGGDLAIIAVEGIEKNLRTLPSPSNVTLFILMLSISEIPIVPIVARSPLLLPALIRFTAKCLEARLLSHYQNVSDAHLASSSVSAGQHGGVSLSDFILGLECVFGSGSGSNVSSGRSGSSAAGARFEVLPLVLSPQYLSAILLGGGFFSQAAHIYWTAVLRRPTGMFTASAATSLLFVHISQSALPFYLSSPDAPKEVAKQAWGWGKWREICEDALQ